MGVSADSMFAYGVAFEEDAVDDVDKVCDEFYGNSDKVEVDTYGHAEGRLSLWVYIKESHFREYQGGHKIIPQDRLQVKPAWDFLLYDMCAELGLEASTPGWILCGYTDY